ncbi:hypothetical protein F8388_012415 [Cannabis sativa]|uniref:Uncharacterized protein n=1 Tax=Cannabis sativa TaxID=3483 RepID=A0A7J6H0G5_CANSA|nr:hypothetical protein G4B88_026358 [Cannabis sativa]KAF4388438.1 hypothetical protein F8388_012415 [Cannabis sativa]
MLFEDCFDHEFSGVFLPDGQKSNLAPPQFVHTLNATAGAVRQMLVCLLENYQQEDGSVIIIDLTL